MKSSQILNATRPRVYVSATQSDLGSVRQAIVEALLEAGCEPVEVLDYPPYWRTADRLLRDQIGSCYALIHVAGVAYGPEPQLPTKPSGEVRHSFAQMEYHIGCQLRDQSDVRPFLLHTLIGPADFAYDEPSSQEPLAQQDLQWQHSASLAAAPGVQEIPGSVEEIAALIKSWFPASTKTERADATSERKKPSPQAARPKNLRFPVAATVILIGLGCIGWAVSELMRKPGGGRAAAVAAAPVVQIPADKLIAAYLDRFRAWRFALSTIPNAYVDQLVRADLPSVLGMTPEIVTQALSSEMEHMSRQSADITAKLGALFVLGRYQSVLEHGAVHKETLDDRGFHILGDAAMARHDEEYATRCLTQAVEFYRKACAGTLRQRSPAAWSQCQAQIANALLTQGLYSEALPIVRAAEAVQEQSLPEDLPGTLMLHAIMLNPIEDKEDAEAEALVKRAAVLVRDKSGSAIGHYARVNSHLLIGGRDEYRWTRLETSLREVIARLEKEFGQTHPSLVKVLRLLAQRLSRKDVYSDHSNKDSFIGQFCLAMNRSRNGEAESIFRRTLAMVEASRGPVHPEVSNELIALGRFLVAEGRPSEAEALFRRSLGILETCFGKEHSSTTVAQSDLASCLVKLKRGKEAEPLLKSALARLDNLDAGDGQDAATILFRLIEALSSLDRQAEALPIIRRRLAILEKTTDKDNINLIGSLADLAHCLYATYGFAEGAQVAERAMRIAFRYNIENDTSAELTIPAIKLYFLNATRNQQSLEQARAKVEQMASAAGVTPETAKEMIDEAIK